MARENAWAVAIAREMASDIPEVVRMVPDLKLTPQQIEDLRRAFEAYLIRTMK
jgi:hypothetical protein